MDPNNIGSPQTQTPQLVPQQPVQSQTAAPIIPPQQPPWWKRRRTILSIVAGVVVVFIILLLIIAVVKPKKQADVLLATVGSEKIYKSTVQKEAEQQYVPSQVNETVLKEIYPQVIERAILDQQAKEFSITVTNEQIRNEINIIFPSYKNKIPTANVTASAKYSLIKTALLPKIINNLTAYTLGFSIAPYTYKIQKPEYATQRFEGNNALNEIEVDLKNNEDPYQIATTIYSNYPALQGILGLNGRLFLPDAQYKNLYENPSQLPLYRTENMNYYDEDLYNAVLKTKVGEVVKVAKTNGAGGYIFKAIGKTTNGYDSYDDFLKAKKKSLVKTYNSL